MMVQQQRFGLVEKQQSTSDDEDTGMDLIGRQRATGDVDQSVGLKRNPPGKGCSRQ